MIAASGILVVVAFVTLVLGVFKTGLGLIWTSIAASVLAAIFLALGVVQSGKRGVATVTGPFPEPSEGWPEAPVGTAVLEPEPEPGPAPEPAVMEPVSLEPEARRKPEPAPRAGRPARAAGRGKTAAAASAGVVVIPDRDKFHKESCRYAKSAAAMTMTKAAARGQGYKPCGVCKP